MPLPKFIEIDGSAIGGARFCNAAASRLLPAPEPSNRPCSSSGKITGPPPIAPPPDAIANRRCSRLSIGRAEP